MTIGEHGQVWIVERKMGYTWAGKEEYERNAEVDPTAEDFLSFKDARFLI